MFSTTCTAARLTLASSIAILALFVSLFIFQTPAAFAQSGTSMTASELQAMIQKLTAQIIELQNGIAPAGREVSQPKATSTTGSGLNPKTNPNVETFTIGSSVQPTMNVRVRKLPNRTGAVIGTENSSSRGVVLAGPKTQAGYTWYKVSFKAGVTGWVPAQRLSDATPNLDGYNCTPGAACPGSVLATDVQPFVETLLAVAQPNTQNVGAKGNSIDAYFEIEITAQDSPLYVNKNSFNLFPSLGEKSPATDNPDFSQVVTSKDATEAGPYYFVGKGETRSFRVSYKYFPRESGEYTVVMQNFEFALSPTGRPFRHELFPNRPQTNVALFRMGTTATNTSSIGTTSCVSGVKKYSEGTKLQQITVDGQTKVIADAAYVCRGGIWKIEGSLPIKPIDPTISAAYGLAQIKSITFKDSVTQSPITAFGSISSNWGTRTERTYTVTLKTEKVILVREIVNGGGSSVDPIKASGFTGTSAEFRALATRAPAVKGASIDMLSEISTTLISIKNILSDLK